LTTAHKKENGINFQTTHAQSQFTQVNEPFPVFVALNDDNDLDL
jgi:hypothetical protein